MNRLITRQGRQGQIWAKNIYFIVIGQFQSDSRFDAILELRSEVYFSEKIIFPNAPLTVNYALTGAAHYSWCQIAIVELILTL